jgi:hypothetical protein
MTEECGQRNGRLKAGKGRETGAKGCDRGGRKKPGPVLGTRRRGDNGLGGVVLRLEQFKKNCSRPIGAAEADLGRRQLGTYDSYAPALPMTHLHLRCSQINDHLFS